MFTVGLWAIIGFQLLVRAGSTTTTPEPKAEADCIIPEGHTDGEEVPSVHEPRRGHVCTIESPVVVTRRQCEKRYCCEIGCTCNDELYENEPACTQHNLDAVIVHCFLEQNTTRQFRFICCDGYFEDEERGCAQMLTCELHNGYCAHNCSSTNETNTEAFPGLHVFNYGNYLCSCHDGYRLQNNDFTCEDIDECSAPESPCDHICTNNEGSFVCTCRPGYHLGSDKSTCYDIDECAAPESPCEHTCTNNAGSYVCSCGPGYHIGPDKSTCYDTNECIARNVRCHHGCVNFDGIYSCFCFAGYRGKTSNNFTCQDINECSESGGRLCQQICRNTEGSYVCFCKVGFLLSSDRSSCTDIDECDQYNGGCQQGCTNTAGSYFCSCNQQYSLEEDNRTCVKVTIPDVKPITRKVNTTTTTPTTSTTPIELVEETEGNMVPAGAAASKTRSASMSLMPLYIAVPLLIVAVLTIAVLLLHRIQVHHNKIRNYVDVTASVDEDDDDDDDDDANDSNANESNDR